MATHTPGPWSINKDRNEVYRLYDYSRVLRMRAEVITYSPLYGENGLNLSLIAAAPELLEALEGIVGSLCLCDDSTKEGHPSESSLGNKDRFGNHIWGDPCMYCVGYAAIAKARGL